MSPCRRKIRVCHLASGDLWAGAEIQVANVCRGLRDTGEVDARAVVLNGGRLAGELRSFGLDVTVMDEQTSTSWQILWQLTQYLRRRPVDVLHTHRYKENILGSVAAKMSDIPHVVRTVHGMTEMYSGWRWLKAKTYQSLDDMVCRYRVSGLIGVSHEISEYLGRRFRGKAVTYIPNCIDQRRLVITRGRREKRWELGLKLSDFVIGTVGRVSPVKGTQYLIRAVPDILKRHGDVRVLIVGDGPLRPELEAQVRSLGLEKTVAFLGWRDDTIDIINALDLFVLPSLHEGMPTVLLEAMSLSVPVVASATGGIPRILADGSNGLLAEPGSESSLAGKCSCLISNASFANQLAKNAMHDVRKYHLAETLAPLLNFYRQLAKSTEAK